MKAFAALSLLLLASAALAGCAGSSSQKSLSPSPSHGAAAVSSGSASEVGSIRGNVTDDEFNAIGNASVGIIRLNTEVLTTSGGTFEFTNVPVGDQDLAAARLGYQSSSKRVKVVAGATTWANFELRPLAVQVSYPQALNHRALHHAAVTQYMTWAINYTTGLQNTCDGCSWKLRAPAPDFLFVEDFGQHAVAKPAGTAAGGPQEFIWIFKDTYESNNEAGNNTVMSLPGNHTWNKAELGPKEKAWWIQILCDPYWVCYEESRDIWTTLFYGYDAVPDGYSARSAA